jgi:lanosterol synthase
VDGLNAVLSAYERCAFAPLLARAYRLIVMEDENTAYQTVGSVLKMFNLLVRAHVEGPNSFAYKEHARKRQDFMWLGSEGMLMCGTNASQLWDIAFVTQAVVDTGLRNAEENKRSRSTTKRLIDMRQKELGLLLKFVRITFFMRFLFHTIHKYSTRG